MTTESSNLPNDFAVSWVCTAGFDSRDRFHPARGVVALCLAYCFFSLPALSLAGQVVLRDPFRPPPLANLKKQQSGLQAGGLGEFRLVGIIWGTEQPRAMVEDKAGIGYILQPGMTVGLNKARVKEILKDRIIIEERSENDEASQRRQIVLTLAQP